MSRNDNSPEYAGKDSYSPWPISPDWEEEITKAIESLKRIRNAAIRNKSKICKGNLKFTSMHHHLSIGMLALSFSLLNDYAVPGIDDVTKEEYQRNLGENLTRLRYAIINDTFRFTAVRRVYIPKPDGGQRPLGICIIEDKIVQGAVKLVLEAFYDPLFAGMSYGFRPRTRAHDGLDALYMAINNHPVNYILDADIRKCFDNIDQDVLMEILKLRIGDRKLLKIIGRMMKAGVLEEHRYHKSTIGVVQGSVISPLFANIFLDHVIDQFYRYWRDEMNYTYGFTCMVRYADDFIMGFQYEHQAKRFLEILRDRLLCAGLRLHKDKTRLIEFGKFAKYNRKKRGEGKPETFNFLGFTHICGINFKMRTFKLLRKTISDRLNTKMNELYCKIRYWLQCGHRIDTVIFRVNQILTGYFNYFAVPDNIRTLTGLRYRVMKALYKFINKRSQKRSMNWEKFNETIAPMIAYPGKKHAYPNQRMAVRQQELKKARYTTSIYDDLKSLAKAICG